MKFLTRRWPIHLLAAIGLSILALSFQLDNSAEVYSISRLVVAPLLALPVFFALAWFSNRLIWPAWEGLKKNERGWILGISAAALSAGLWLFPLAQPDFLTPHHLILSATGQKGRQSTGTTVLVRQIIFLDGRPVESAALSSSTDWQLTDLGYISSGSPQSRLELQGPMPAGIRLILHYSEAGGQARLEWDGQVRVIDLYAPEPANLPLVLRIPGIFALPAGKAAAAALAALCYAMGMAFPILAGLVIFFKLLGNSSPRILQWGVLCVIVLLFLVFKLLYLQIDDPHIMGDSLSYVTTAQFPLDSLRFWLGQRPFTIPLAIKLFGFTLDDYFLNNQLARWANFQTLFSAGSWLVFAAALAWTTPKRWLRVLLFALVLCLSLSMEISLWDALLLSESLSFSLLVLMLTCWLGLVLALPTLRRAWLRWGLVTLSLLVTILYAFGRDSNIYFALAGAAVMALGAMIETRLRRNKTPLLVYAAAVGAIFIAHTVSLNAGNRWQVFLYDHLGMRILLDPQATAFFAGHGLPISQSLLEITQMRGSQYQKLINESPELKPVKDWVACCGKSVYIQYLLSDPLRTISQPYENWQVLVNGSLRGYRNPHNGVVPMPQKLLQISNLFFKISAWGVAVLCLACLIGLTIYLRSPTHSIWLLVTAIALPILPMMWFIWWAEPMEIDRHAAQVIIQLRLAGWIALALLAGECQDFLSAKSLARHKAVGV